MRIDGMDALSGSYSIPQDSTISTKEIKADSNNTQNTEENKKTTPNIDTLDISSLTNYQKKELSVSDKVIIDAIEKANKSYVGSTRRFEFSIHSKTKQIMVKVIDTDTNEVVREIPPEKTLDLVAKMWEMAGIIVDERR